MHDYSEELLTIVDRLPTTVPEVIQQQSDLQNLLIGNAKRSKGVSGLAYFNHLYTIVTKEILSITGEGRAAHPDFLSTLDVELARRYFQGIGAWLRDPKVAPRSWGVLLDQAYDHEITAIQFAVAGANAQVNFDLALSLVAAFRRLGVDFDEEYRADYRFVNEIYRQKIPQLRNDFQGDFWDTVDKLLGEVDDWLDDIMVIATRELAWYAARRIWPDRDDPAEMAKEIRRLDRFASTLGRGMLLHRSEA